MSAIATGKEMKRMKRRVLAVRVWINMTRSSFEC